jgi:hypothetical protein
MFIAEMWGYGRDDNCVGVDGIDACMGVFVLYGGKLFAIHSPASSETVETLGRDEFVAYFKKKNPGYEKGAQVYAVVNRLARGDRAKEEVRGYHEKLKAETTQFIRVTNAKGNIAVVCELDPHTDGVKLKYKEYTEVKWMAENGAKREGNYNKDGEDHGYGVDSTKGWTPIVDPGNAQIISIGTTSPDALLDAPSLTVLASSNRSKKSDRKCVIM